MSIARKLLNNPDQYWIGLLGGSSAEYFRGVAVDSVGNIIAAGQTTSDGAGGGDAFIAKYNAAGELQWVFTLGGAGNDIFRAVTVDSADNIIAAGQTDSDGAGGVDGLIAKFNSSGSLLWDYTLGGTGADVFLGVAVDSVGTIIAVGQTTSDGAGGTDCLIAKYNSSGALQWDRTLGGTGTDAFNAVTVDSADNIIAVGYTTSDGAGFDDCLIAKYNSSGALQWDYTLGGTSSERFNGVAIDSAGNIVVAGYTSSGGFGSDDCLLAKYNPTGGLLWQYILGGGSLDGFTAVAVDSDDNIIAVGELISASLGANDGVVAKYDSNGALQWQRALGGTSSDVFKAVTVDPAGGIVVAGESASDGAGSNEAVVARLPANGAGTGIYGSLTYQQSSLNASGSSLSNVAAVLTNVVAVLTSAPAVLTYSVAVVTPEIFKI